MTIQEIFIQSNIALLGVVEQIHDEQWSMMLPDGASREPTDLRTAVNYHAYDDAFVPDTLAGKTMQEVGDVYDSLKDSANTLADYRAHNARAIDAARSFSDLEAVTHLSYGDFPARDYLQHITSYRIGRCQTFAAMIGAKLELGEDFAQALIDEYTPIIDSYRQMGVFGPALEAPASADAQTRFYAMLGLNS
jgi:hypothetical protein